MQKNKSILFTLLVFLSCCGQVLCMQEQKRYKNFKQVFKDGIIDWVKDQNSWSKNDFNFLKNNIFPRAKGELVNNQNFAQDILVPLFKWYNKNETNNYYDQAVIAFIDVVQEHAVNSTAIFDKAFKLLGSKFEVESFKQKFLTKKEVVPIEPTPELDALAFALKDLGTCRADTKFLNEFLSKCFPNRLIKVATNYNKKHGARIYQLEVLGQTKAECGIHAFRNALYFFDIFNHPWDSFEAIYNKMISYKQYEAFVNTVGCPRDQGASDNSLKPVIKKIKEFKVKCVPSCIPQGSSKYVDQMMRGQFYWPTKTELVPKPLLYFMKKTKEVQKVIKNIEQNIKNKEQVVNDIALITPLVMRDKSYIKRIQAFCENKNGLLIWSLGTVQTGSENGHAVTLVEHKYDGKIEYVYADPNNIQLGLDPAIGKTIDAFISLTSSLEYFNDIVVRYFYYDNFAIDWFVCDLYVEHCQKFYNDLKQYNLLKNKLYTSVYKPALINGIKQACKDKDSKLYKDVLKTLENN